MWAVTHPRLDQVSSQRPGVVLVRPLLPVPLGLHASLVLGPCSRPRCFFPHLPRPHRSLRLLGPEFWPVLFPSHCRQPSRGRSPFLPPQPPHMSVHQRFSSMSSVARRRRRRASGLTWRQESSVPPVTCFGQESGPPEPHSELHYGGDTCIHSIHRTDPRPSDDAEHLRGIGTGVTKGLDTYKERKAVNSIAASNRPMS